jgi:hypothetical protein
MKEQKWGLGLFHVTADTRVRVALAFTLFHDVVAAFCGAHTFAHFQHLIVIVHRIASRNGDG